MAPLPAECTTKVYRSEDVAIDLLTLPADYSSIPVVHYRKCAGILVIHGILAVFIDGKDNRYVRADTGPAFIPAGMVYAMHALSDVDAVVFYRATPDSVVSDSDIHAAAPVGE